MPLRKPLDTPLMDHVRELRLVVLRLVADDMVGEITRHHLEYMLDCMEKMTSYGKLNRWIGFVHGVLAVHGFLSIDQLRDMIKDTDIVTENSEEKAIVLGTVEDAVTDFMYYDRKNDEELSVAGLAEALDEGLVSLEEIGEEFIFHLCKNRSK